MGTQFTIRSPNFQHGDYIPPRFTAEGRDHPPRLEWSTPPDGTRSFVLIMDDSDAPGGTFTHWIRFDIPAECREIDKSATVGIGGLNDFHHAQYGGPKPPPHHGAHRYRFHLYALDIESLGLDEGASRQEVEKAMEGHILRESTLVGRFERPRGGAEH